MKPVQTTNRPDAVKTRRPRLFVDRSFFAGGESHVVAEPTRPAFTARVEQWLRALSWTDAMHFVLLSLLVLATAKAVLPADEAQAEDGKTAAAVPSHAFRKTNSVLDTIRAEGLSRIAEGVPAADVRAWMLQATVAAGYAAERTPTVPDRRYFHIAQGSESSRGNRLVSMPSM